MVDWRLFGVVVVPCCCYCSRVTIMCGGIATSLVEMISNRGGSEKDESSQCGAMRSRRCRRQPQNA